MTTRVGVPFLVRVLVQNDTAEIRNVSVRVPMLVSSAYTVRPLAVSVFPNELTEIEVEVTLPLDTAAGPGILPVELHDDRGGNARLDCLLEVEPRDLIGLTISPRTIKAGSKATIIATIDNRGNRSTGVSISAIDADRRLKYSIEPRGATLDAGESRAFTIVAQGRRPIWGQSRAAAITIGAECRSQRESDVATFESKPLLSRGLLTILMLVGILALWVLIFTIGFRAALAGQEPKKSAPATFATGLKPDPTISVASIQSRVLADSDSRPLARMVVTAKPLDGSNASTAASTDEDGSFVVAGLAPGRYSIEISGSGFTTLALPDPIRIRPGDEVKLDPVFMTGAPGVLDGVINAGGVPVGGATVEARLMQGDISGTFVTTAATDGTGRYTLTGLVSPARYRLTFTSPGYDPVQLFQEVAPGETVTLPTTQLTSGPGTITGVVIGSDGLPLGGAEVSATAGGKEVKTVTATSGEIGSFVLSGLPSPATYLIQVSLDGFGTQTLPVAVGPGEVRALATPIIMSKGTGTVSGNVVSIDGKPLGAVAVTASNGLPIAQTTTVDGGDFLLSGLPVPGSYTITFELDGYETQVVSLVLPQQGRLRTVVLAPKTANAVGTYRVAAGQVVSGVPVTAISGPLSAITLTDGTGRYAFAGLQPGWWTVTFGDAANPQAVVLLQLTAGANDLGTTQANNG